MNTDQKFLSPIHALRVAVLALSVVAPPSAPAATVWTGPTITYTQPGTDPTQPANQDRMTANVWLTRAASHGIFNAKTETSYIKPSSPADTEWAVEALADATTLSYSTWSGAGGGHPVLNLVNKQLVLHLISDEIYLSVKFTALGGHGVGGFSYLRSTPAVALPSPTVGITNPTSGDVFTAPANVQIQADAAVSSGSVTNVAFFANGALLGADQLAPFSITAPNLAAGGVALTAVATAAEISTTSAVVNITVVSPIAIALTSQQITISQFAFDYTANPGLSYVVQNSSNLVDWVSVLTNVATSNPVHFADSVIPNLNRYYRVGRQQ